ncbi:TldD/PmbA family protein [Methylocystis parvus]|uniref:TldD/PmbA family protein n=1 Tax=Methylocystis parvus TaxID=134 RepID=A0A6B8M4J2_9HYPH|nr:TldD/PmbA family protein [Methylocystis parvus]QGM96293.1 TldD/PmbA family protein [Methylocystis parvus]WBJ99869.1 TldD/PmbA family protein [Methylocystis parvus OBBP]
MAPKFAPLKDAPERSAASDGGRFALDRALLDALADLALQAARRAGASYADIRLGETLKETAYAKDDRLEQFDERSTRGFGLRVLLDGSWGFYGARRLDAASVAEGVERALENARAVRPIQGRPIALEELPAHEAEWIMPMGVDPFSISTREKADLLLAISAAARDNGADFCTALLCIAREERLFASTFGARIRQTRTRVQPTFTATAIDRAAGRMASRDSLTPARGAGWEYVTGAGLLEEAALAGRQAREKLSARPVVAGDYDLILDPTNLWLTIHETVGHSTELDRVLGWEANFAGTSFVKPAMLGNLRFGSELMTIVADRSQPGALSTIGYDDDGAPASSAEFKIVEKGVFKNFQMALGQAHYIGLPGSNGCAYADSPTSFPIQRMPNISLAPNPDTCKLDDLASGVENGIYVVGAGSWSIDQQRDNFQFGGQLFYEIKNGEIGDMLRDVAYQSRTIPFWNSLDGLGDASTYHLDGTFTCGKAEPVQVAPVSHGAPLARFRNVRVLNTSGGV